MIGNTAGDLARTDATQPVEGVTAAIQEAREDLRRLAASGDRVTIGWTFSDGSAHKEQHVYPAADAQYVLDTLEGVCESTGLTIQSLTVWRMEGGLFLDDEPAPFVEQPTAEQALHEIRVNATSPGSAMTHEGFEAALSRLPLAGDVVAATYSLYPVAADQQRVSKPSELVVMLNQLADDLDDMRGQDEMGQNYRIGTSIVSRVRAIARLAAVHTPTAESSAVTLQINQLADELEDMRGQDYKVGTSIVSRVRAIARLAADDLLGGIRARAEDARRNREMYSKESLSRRNRNEASAADVPWLLAEVSRLGAVATDQAETIQRVEDLIAAGEAAFAKIGVPGAVDLPAVRRALDGDVPERPEHEYEPNGYGDRQPQ